MTPLQSASCPQCGNVVASFLSVEAQPPPDTERYPFVGLPGTQRECTIQWGCLQCGHRFETQAAIEELRASRQ